MFIGPPTVRPVPCMCAIIIIIMDKIINSIQQVISILILATSHVTQFLKLYLCVTLAIEGIIIIIIMNSTASVYVYYQN